MQGDALHLRALLSPPLLSEKTDFSEFEKTQQKNEGKRKVWSSSMEGVPSKPKNRQGSNSLPYNCSPPLPQPLKSRMQGKKKSKKETNLKKYPTRTDRRWKQKRAIKKSCMCPVPDIPAAAGFQRVIHVDWTPASPCSGKGLCQL